MNVTDFEDAYRQRHFVRVWLLNAGMKDSRHADIEDAVQEVYRRLWAGRERYVPMGESLYFPMLKRISFSVATDFHRRGQARHDQPWLPLFDPPGADDTTLAETRAVLWQILGALSPRHRALLWMRWVWGSSKAQIARTFKLTLPQVHTALNGAMAAAKKVASTHQENTPCPPMTGTSRTRTSGPSPKRSSAA